MGEDAVIYYIILTQVRKGKTLFRIYKQIICFQCKAIVTLINWPAYIIGALASGSDKLGPLVTMGVWELPIDAATLVAKTFNGITP